MNTGVHMAVRWAVPQGESRAIADALQGLMVATRAEPGCVCCSFTAEMGSLVLIRYFESWRTQNDLVRQLRSERFAILAELMETASQRPVVEFALHGTTRGLDYAEEVRQVGPPPARQPWRSGGTSH